VGWEWGVGVLSHKHANPQSYLRNPPKFEKKKQVFANFAFVHSIVTNMRLTVLRMSTSSGWMAKSASTGVTCSPGARNLCGHAGSEGG
jgi:hypothetical protein